MSAFRRSPTTLGYPLIAALGLVSAALMALASPVLFPQQPVPEPKVIDVVGDLQQTSFADKVFLARGENDEARKAIIAQIARDKPDLLLLLGNLVADGEAEGDWADFDAFMKPILDSNIRTRAVIGNHDYGLTDPKRGLKYLYKRYPNTRQRPSVDIFGRIAVVMFNSNFDRLRPGEITQQADSFKVILAKLDADPAVRAVIVCAHHPPYSNSRIGANEDVIEMFATPFQNARKTRLILSGHVHSYERFRSGDKVFIVTGGGGASRNPVSIDADRRFTNDEYRPGRSVRPFNFVRLTLSDAVLAGDAMMLKSDGSFFVGDHFELPL